MNKRGLVLFIVGLLTTTIRAFAQPSTSPLEWNSRGLTLSDFIVSEAYSDRASNSSIQWLEKAGLSADYCLSSIWNLFHRKLTDIQLRGRLYITRERIADYSGYSINIGVGIAPKFCKTH